MFIERQCTLKGQAWYVNVWGSVHWKGVYRVGDRDLGVQNFFNTLSAACISRAHTGWCRPFLSAVFQCVYFPTSKASNIDILLLL